MPDPAPIVRFIDIVLVYGSAIGLLFVSLEFLQFTGVLRARPRTSSAARSRLAVIEISRIDRERRIILVRRDQIEHLILLGGSNDLILETRFVRLAPAYQGPQRAASALSMDPAPPAMITAPLAAMSEFPCQTPAASLEEAMAE